MLLKSEKHAPEIAGATSFRHDSCRMHSRNCRATETQRLVPDALLGIHRHEPGSAVPLDENGRGLQCRGKGLARVVPEPGTPLRGGNVGNTVTMEGTFLLRVNDLLHVVNATSNMSVWINAIETPKSMDVSSIFMQIIDFSSKPFG